MKKQQHKFDTVNIPYNGMIIRQCTRVDNGVTHYEVGELALSTLKKARFVVDEIKVLIAKDKENGNV